MPTALGRYPSTPPPARRKENDVRQLVKDQQKETRLKAEITALKAGTR
jgi:hypothetical protein